MAWPRPKTKETIFNDFLIYNTSDQGGRNKRIERQKNKRKFGWKISVSKIKHNKPLFNYARKNLFPRNCNIVS